MTLMEFSQQAKKIAYENEMNIKDVAVYAFVEGTESLYVCQTLKGNEILRTPAMKSPEKALDFFAKIMGDITYTNSEDIEI